MNQLEWANSHMSNPIVNKTKVMKRKKNSFPLREKV